MTVIIHKNKTLADLPFITISGDLEARAASKLNTDVLIRQALEKDKSYNVWAPAEYFGYKNDSYLYAESIMVSIKGEVAYMVDDELHIASGSLQDDFQQITLTVIDQQMTFGIARLVASTFLGVPDKYKGISQHDLEVIHLDGHPHQCHFANLEWNLNESKELNTVIEETVSALNTELPSE